MLSGFELGPRWVPLTKICLLPISKYHNKAFDVNAIFYKGTQKRVPKYFRLLKGGITLQVNFYFLLLSITIILKKR